MFEEIIKRKNEDTTPVKYTDKNLHTIILEL